MNWLDRTIGYLSAEAGLRRVRARIAYETIRGYDAAKVGRHSDGWKTRSSSANAEIVPSLSKSRDRARDLVRNNPYAARAIDTLTAKSVGTGILGKPEKAAAKTWKKWSENPEACDFDGQSDFYGLQSLVARSSFESGECLIRRIRMPDGEVPLQLQVLEADYIDNTKFGVLSNGNMAVSGIEVDRMGRRVAYWLWPQHPGENTLLPRRFESVRVEASEIIHFYEKRRPGQLRGMSRLVTAIMRLRNLDDYQEAELLRKKIEACFAAFVIGGDGQHPLGEATTSTTTGKRTETFSPGMIEYIPAGQDVKFGTPSASSVSSGFTKDELHAIAVGSGVTYEQLTGDLAGVTFSSIRSGMQDFRDLVDTWRYTQFIPGPCRRVFSWFEDAAWTAGRLRTSSYICNWTPPRWPYVNPVDDVKADKEEVLAGFSTISRKVRERGEDPDETFDESGEERKKLKDKNVIVDVDAGNKLAKTTDAADAGAPTNKPDTGEPAPDAKDKK